MIVALLQAHSTREKKKGKGESKKRTIGEATTKKKAKGGK